jgi:hypothetical protein
MFDFILILFFSPKIKSGEIFASINQKDGMVVFKDDPEKYNSPAMFLNVQDDINRVMELNKQITKMEEEIMLNPTVGSIHIFVSLDVYAHVLL